MLFRNKRGIELSINFIVMLVLGLAMFGGGLAFATKFFGHAEKVRGNLDSQTEKQIEKLLDSGSPVVIPISTKEIFRNKFDTFGVGVLAQQAGRYELTVASHKAFKKDKTPITINTGSWIKPQLVQSQELEKNEKGKFLIGVEVPKGIDSGTYIFQVSVSFFTTPDSPPDAVDIIEYDYPVQFFVNVP